jgi:hypothetical protein
VIRAGQRIAILGTDEQRRAFHTWMNVEAPVEQ